MSGSRFPLAMAFTLFFLLIASTIFIGGVQASCEDNDCYPFNYFPTNKGIMKRSIRKLMEVEVMVDYEKPGPNPKHEGGRGARPIAAAGLN